MERKRGKKIWAPRIKKKSKYTPKEKTCHQKQNKTKITTTFIHKAQWILVWLVVWLEPKCFKKINAVDLLDRLEYLPKKLIMIIWLCVCMDGWWIVVIVIIVVVCHFHFHSFIQLNWIHCYTRFFSNDNYRSERERKNGQTKKYPICKDPTFFLIFTVERGMRGEAKVKEFFFYSFYRTKQKKQT